MLDRSLRALSALGIAWIFALMLLVGADIVSRFVFNSPISGVAEIAGFSVIAITFLQLPAAVHSGRLARADLVLQRIRVQSPGAARAIERVFALLGALVFLAIIWAAVSGLGHAWRTNDQFGAQGVFTFPKWPIWLLVLTGSAGAVAAFAVQVVRGPPSAVGSGARHGEL
ncbi:MAG: TRAP transporter small permease [Betaproteobacteria bacterium]|nr:TRAP transporter small permease [Betaproteobacteria bacterium]